MNSKSCIALAIILAATACGKRPNNSAILAGYELKAHVTEAEVKEIMTLESEPELTSSTQESSEGEHISTDSSSMASLLQEHGTQQQVALSDEQAAFLGSSMADLVDAVETEDHAQIADSVNTAVSKAEAVNLQNKKAGKKVDKAAVKEFLMNLKDLFQAIKAGKAGKAKAKKADKADKADQDQAKNGKDQAKAGKKADIGTGDDGQADKKAGCAKQVKAVCANFVEML